MSKIIDVLPHELAYFAGLFDGEGGILLARNINGRGRVPEANLSLKACIVNAHLGCLRRAQSHFAGTINTRKVLSKKESWSTVYDWVVCGKKAADFLGRISPYADVKKPQIEAVLTFAETLFPQWKERHGRGNSLQLTREALHLRRIAFRVFRCEIEKLCGRGIQWTV